jgi:hypothetical protein
MGSPYSGYSSVTVRFFYLLKNSKLVDWFARFLDFYYSASLFFKKKAIIAQLCVTSVFYATRTHHCHRIN